MSAWPRRVPARPPRVLVVGVDDVGGRAWPVVVFGVGVLAVPAAMAPRGVAVWVAAETAVVWVAAETAVGWVAAESAVGWVAAREPGDVARAVTDRVGSPVRAPVTTAVRTAAESDR